MSDVLMPPATQIDPALQAAFQEYQEIAAAATSRAVQWRARAATLEIQNQALVIETAALKKELSDLKQQSAPSAGETASAAAAE